MSKPYDEETIAEINIIPFVDIILVVLIIFMMTAPHINIQGLKIQLPKASGSVEGHSKSSKLDISVHYTGDIFVEGRLISVQDLSLLARKLFEKNPSLNTVISADKSVSHGRVMEIMGALKESGIQNFIFSSSP